MMIVRIKDHKAHEPIEPSSLIVVKKEQNPPLRVLFLYTIRLVRITRIIGYILSLTLSLTYSNFKLE